MANRNKNIEVEIKETTNQSDALTELEVLVKNKVIGTVRQPLDEQVAVSYKTEKEMTAKTIDEGIQMIIAEYNLHDQ
ncbi:DUF2969 family protein [Marinilactibacillus psychrotolerans]|uniref:DUF2969 domain-containing protein n=1 Tax=Marinilactibacillus psychrotolerans TaxID=191770 RepID=A0A5R9C6V3_9LACT|nr:DUF2969 family protein [Marinilactibacillus psychrotolerans]TLQ08868.1 DUF2969 domain-containing protein [Marinilactibacillus psychrotolerans]